MLMGFQKHETEEEKLHRKNKYWVLRNICKLSSHDAIVFRDWSDNKVAMIINGEAKPIPKW
jgi:hypothetical protein